MLMKSSLALALLVCCACGGKRPGSEASAAGPTGHSDVQGTLHGQPFTAADSLSYVGTDAAGNSFLTIWVTSFANACGLASENSGVRDASVLVLDLSNPGLSSPGEPGPRSAASQPGEYPVGAAAGGRSAQAAALHTDDACRAASLGMGAASGTVTLAKLGPSGASGTFDLRFGASGDHLAGAFEAVACPAAPLSARAPATSCR